MTFQPARDVVDFIVVEYRVNWNEATQFRRWATEVLKKYIIKEIK